MRCSSIAGACAALVGVAACGQTHVIGFECPDGKCALQLPANDACSAQFMLPPATVLPGADAQLTRCQVFTLDALDPGRFYLTHARAQMLPYSHQLDVAIAREAPGLADGMIDCAAAQSRQIAWMPLVASEGGTDDFPFESAAISSERTQRLLISDRFINLAPDPIEVGVRLDFECTRTSPKPVVGQVFAFERRTQGAVGRGERVTVSGSCPFHNSVIVKRVAHPIEPMLSDFSVAIDNGMPFADLNRHSQSMPSDAESGKSVTGHDEWSADPPYDQFVQSGHTLDWKCVYENLSSDVPIQIGGDAPTLCSLFGLYARQDGGEDDEPEHCELR